MFGVTCQVGGNRCHGPACSREEVAVVAVSVGPVASMIERGSCLDLDEGYAASTFQQLPGEGQLVGLPQATEGAVAGDDFVVVDGDPVPQLSVEDGVDVGLLLCDMRGVPLIHERMGYL